MKRIAYFDNAKGILIIFIILAHVLSLCSKYYNYSDDGTLELYMKDTNNDDVDFSINFDVDFGSLDTGDSIDGFLRFLNQDITEENKSILTSSTPIKTFKNVWDREYLEFHASFSDSKRRFIGIKGDFYEKPSVLYNSPTDGSTFNVKFTSDGVHPIYPKYCRFIIQLCFVYNYRKRLVD